MKAGWDLFRKAVQLDEPAPANLYLGCEHTSTTVDLENGGKARAVVYNMESYFQSTVNKYCELVKETTGESVVLKHADTPFLVEDKRTSPQQKPCSTDLSVECPWCKFSFPTDKESTWAKPPESLTGDIYPPQI